MVHSGCRADCRFVEDIFPRESTLNAETLCSRKRPHPTFPGVMERAPGLLTSWVTLFAWLSLSVCICKMEFLFPDCLFASILAVPCSDTRQRHAGGVPYDQFLTQRFGPLNTLSPGLPRCLMIQSLETPLGG